jgi:UDP-N-acetyl-D-glucosamine dehydrogenase
MSTAAMPDLAHDRTRRSEPGRDEIRVVDLTRRRVGIVGLGYVGLPTALSLASKGMAVVGVDVQPSRLEAIRSGDVDLLPSDRHRLETVVSQPDLLRLTTDPADLVGCRTVLICVPTPVDEHMTPDLRALSAACRTVVEHAVRGQVIVLTSTTYVGCTRELLVEPLRSRGLEPGVDVHVAFSPERIDPGNETHPQESVPRVLGGVTPACTRAAADVLGIASSRIHEVSSPEAAELTKLYENTFRAVNIALANDLADVSRGLGVSVTEVIDAAASKPYGFVPFRPGPGVGGHCIPVDPHYLLWQLRAARTSSPLIEQAMTSIAARPRSVVDRTRALLAERGLPLAGAHVLVVGVTYKAGVQDVRESPALEVLDRMRAAGARVQYTDPLVPELRLPSGAVLHSVADPAAAGADLVVLHTLQPGTDSRWLAAHPHLLDTTFRFDDAPARATL